MRSASSSADTGTPKTAMTSSPTNLFTVPPCRSSTATACSSSETSHPQRLRVESLAELGVGDDVTRQVTVLRAVEKRSLSRASQPPHEWQNCASGELLAPERVADGTFGWRRPPLSVRHVRGKNAGDDTDRHDRSTNRSPDNFASERFRSASFSSSPTGSQSQGRRFPRWAARARVDSIANSCPKKRASP